MNNAYSLICIITLILGCSDSLLAQPRFDTEGTKQTESINCSGCGCSAPTSLYQHLANPPVTISRTSPSFRVGLNWFGMDGYDNFLGVSLVDNHIYTNGSNGGLSSYPAESQLILVSNDAYRGQTDTNDCYPTTAMGLLHGEGYTLMTRVDPEILIDTVSLRPIIESDTNTGAIHGFRQNDVGTSSGVYHALRTNVTGTYTGNTNAREWLSHDRDFLRFERSGSKSDPMRNGEFLVVSACIRRVGVVSVEDSLPVMKIRLLRQKRFDTVSVDGDTRGKRLLRFSFIPRTDSIFQSPFSGYGPLQTGVSDLPNLFKDFSSGDPPSKRMIDGKFVDVSPPYSGMPLSLPLTTPSGVSGRELVWQYLNDVRDSVGNQQDAPDVREQIVITAGMLKRLRDHPSSLAGSSTDSLDGESYWTLFEGMIVFDPNSLSNADSNLVVYRDDHSNPLYRKYGFASLEPNIRFIRNGTRGNSSGDYSVSKGVITDLELEVEYVGNANIDFDYVVFQTPNTRALLRDQYRSRVSRQIAHAITMLGAEITENSLQSKNFKIFGVRSHEEEGEVSWYGQRYLNILTNGLMISEINNKPYDRYVHVAYPFAASTGSFPEHPLPLWVWNEGSTGRLDPYAAVPFLRHGAGTRGTAYTFGYKTGVAGGQGYSHNATNEALHYGDIPWTVSGLLSTNAVPSLTMQGTQNRRLVADNYTLGVPCDTLTIGSANGQFAYFADAFDSGRKPQLWYDPSWLEWPDRDSSSVNDADTLATCSGLDIKLQLSTIDRPSTIKLSTSLYSEFLSPGNTEFLYKRIPWLEQIWLGTDKRAKRWPVVGETDSLATVLMNRGDQARPYTAEELRIRLSMPILLGSRGAMLFMGNMIPLPYNVHSGNGFGDLARVGFANILNATAYHEAATNTFDPVGLETAAYGADYPTVHTPGEIVVDTLPNCDTCGFPLRKDLVWKITAEGYLDGGSMRLKDGQVQPDRLWVSTSGYRSGGGKSKNYSNTWVLDDTLAIGGIDIVQRVNDNGTINHTAQSVERVYLGHHSARLELLRYTNWLQGSFVNASSVNWYDNNYRSVPGEHEVAGGTSGSATFGSGDLTYSSPTSVAELLARLDLFAWHNRGYAVFNSWRDQDSSDNPLEDWIDLTRIKTRHPYRTFNGRADYEVADSMFVDVMLHKRRLDADTLAYMDEVYLGVSNRRDNPLYMQDPDTTVAFDDQPRFSSTREFFAMVSKPENNHRIYDQLGSRSVLLPFTHAKTAILARKVETAPGVFTTQTYTTPILLHITEVVGGTEVEREYETLYRNPQDSTQTLLRRRIDTIIDPKAAFELSLLPGEGKLLRVRPIPALSTDDIRGNLAFSTQTKLVVAPEQYYDDTSSRWVRTDKVRYHMVYTKSMPVCDTVDEPFLRVCYRRSIPYHRDSVPVVAGLRWEQDEYVFGHAFEVANPAAPQPGTWWQVGANRFPGMPVGTFTRVHSCDSENLNLRINAAFPSITISRSIVDSSSVRDTIQRVHVAYSAVYNVIDDVSSGEHHIVETSFIDGVPDVDANQKTYSLSVIQYDAADTISVDTMLQWGTPTNGITAAPDYDTADVSTFFSDRVVTAWSVRNNHGISAMMRNASLSTAGRAVEYYGRDPVLYPTTHNTEVIGLTQTADTVAPHRRRAQFPSLTPTSSAVGSQTPAVSLVWQEQAVRDSSLESRFDGWAIMYTRLWDPMIAPPSDGLAFGLPGTINQMQYVLSLVPPLELFDAGAGALYGGIYHNMVVRISDDTPGRVSIYPTITRSGLERLDTTSPAMTMSLEEPLPTPHIVNFPYQFETVTFQTVAQNDASTRIHRRHFVHEDISQGPVGPGTAMRYWWMNSTSMYGTNLVAPTVANGAYRFDHQNFTSVGPYPPVYVTGNTSDTVTLSAHGATNGSLLRIDPDDVPSGTLDWKVWNLPRTVWHTHLKYTPIPIHSGGFVAYGDDANSSDRSSATTGIWPHLAHQMHGIDQAKQNIRRIQQDTGSPASSPIFVSAEGFYKRDVGPKWRTKGGYHDGQDIVSVGGLVVDGEEITFRRLERPGSHLESMVASIFYPLPDLVSEPFTVETVKEVDLDFDGTLREGVELYIEEIDGDGRNNVARSVNIGLPERPQADAKTQRKMARWTLSRGGDHALYRFRLHPTGTFVVMEDEILEDVAGVFAKAYDEEADRGIIDLSTMHVGDAQSMMSVLVVPNPARSDLSIIPIVPTYVTQPLTLDIVDAIGQRVISMLIPPAATTQLDVSMLPTGTYVVHLVSSDGLVARTVCTVVR